MARTEPSGRPSAWVRSTSLKMPNAITTSEIEPRRPTTDTTTKRGNFTSCSVNPPRMRPEPATKPSVPKNATSTTVMAASHGLKRDRASTFVPDGASSRSEWSNGGGVEDVIFLGVTSGANSLPVREFRRWAHTIGLRFLQRFAPEHPWMVLNMLTAHGPVPAPEEDPRRDDLIRCLAVSAFVARGGLASLSDSTRPASGGTRTPFGGTRAAFGGTRSTSGSTWSASGGTPYAFGGTWSASGSTRSASGGTWSASGGTWDAFTVTWG
jgi:hypothetical protein